MRSLLRTPLVTLGSLLLLTVSACATRTPAAVPPERDPWQGRGRECVRPFVGRNSPYSELSSDDSRGASLLATIPPEVGRTITAAGLAVLVSRALSAASPPQRLTVEVLVTRQDLGMRLISLETQLAAVIFEAECTGELIEAMTFELEDRSDRREVRLALGSLVVGAITAAVAGIWDLAGSTSKGPPVLGLSGGIGSAALGAAAFKKRPQKMHYAHARNLLKPILQGTDDAELFPRFVFRLLVLAAPDGGPSPRDRLLVRWRALLDEVVERGGRRDAEELLYGAGGVYTQDLLALRERMYDALESELNAQARDLELLDRFLVRALERPLEPGAAEAGAGLTAPEPESPRRGR